MIRMWSSSPQLQWSRQLDFVGPRVTTSIWGWAVLVVGLCAVLTAADQAQGVQQDLAAQQASLHRLQRVQHQRKLAATPSRSASSPDAQWSSEALLSAQGVVHVLAYPWARVLDRVEQAAMQEQALLLSFSLDQDRALTDTRVPPQARLTAAVLTDEGALRWSQALGDGAQLVGRERLGTPAPSPQGDYPWRAEVSWIGVGP